MVEQRWFEVPEELNIWKPGKPGDPEAKLVGLVAFVNPDGKFGLQVDVLDATGIIHTLPSHKVLQSRLARIVGLLTPWKTVLSVEFTGTAPSEVGQDMQMYRVRVRPATKANPWELLAERE